MSTLNNYNEPVTYLPVEKFEHVGTGDNYTFFRLGVFGRSDAVIRFSKVPMPYNNDIVHELGMYVNINIVQVVLKLYVFQLSELELTIASRFGGRQDSTRYCSPTT